MDQSPATIVEAACSCVDYAAGGERPFQHVAEFLALLKRADWSASDIARVQSIAIAELVKRREDRSGALPAAEPT
jgi:hypothetical protein